jgi:hypothetical protein
LVGGKVIPERAGYYIGARMVERLVGDRGIAAALRAPALEFADEGDEVSEGAQSA